MAYFSLKVMITLKYYSAKETDESNIPAFFIVPEQGALEKNLLSASHWER